MKRELSDQEILYLIDGVLRTFAREQRKKESDKRTDAQRRILVGARVPRELAERCRAKAKAQGKSLYRFTVDALEQHLKR